MFAVFFATLVFLKQGSAVLFFKASGLSQFSIPELTKSLEGKRILMVGDSLMRYQYLSLVNMIHTGEFPEKTSGLSALYESRFPSWMEFYNRTTTTLAPNEFCDCYRIERHDWKGYQLGSIKENRYYHDYARNLSVYYIQYFGDHFPLYGDWLPDASTRAFKQEKWKHDNVSEFLSEGVHRYFMDVPTTLVLNAGFHKNLYMEHDHRDEVAASAVRSFPRVIWKTTNFARDELSRKRNTTADDAMCAYKGIDCLDLSWTGYLTRSDFADIHHFQPYVYSDINMQLIELLRLPPQRKLVYMPVERTHSLVTTTDRSPPSTFLVDKYGRLRPFRPHSDHPVPAACAEELARWPHHHLSVKVLLHHIVGDPVADPCFALNDVSVPDGSVIRFEGEPSVFLVEGMHRRPLQSNATVVGMGFTVGQVTLLPKEQVLSIDLGEPVIEKK
jgi:hypothetical protein